LLIWPLILLVYVALDLSLEALLIGNLLRKLEFQNGTAPYKRSFVTFAIKNLKENEIL